MDYNQGQTGFKNQPGQFPDDLQPYRPSPGKIIKKFQNQNDRYFYFRPIGPPGIAQMQAWPGP